MMEWLPIEMGPKDGQRVLLYCPSLRKGREVQFGRWVDREEREYGELTREQKGWVMEGMWMIMSKEPEPTHWMPIPDGP